MNDSTELAALMRRVEQLETQLQRMPARLPQTPAPAPAERYQIRVEDSFHGWSLGDVLKLEAAGTGIGSWTKASIANLRRGERLGVVVAVPSNDAAVVALGGVVDGLSGLTAGAWYYLDHNTSGAVTTDPGNVPVYQALSATEAVLLPSDWGGLPYGWRKSADQTSAPTSISAFDLDETPGQRAVSATGVFYFSREPLAHDGKVIGIAHWRARWDRTTAGMVEIDITVMISGWRIEFFENAAGLFQSMTMMHDDDIVGSNTDVPDTSTWTTVATSNTTGGTFDIEAWNDGTMLQFRLPDGGVIMGASHIYLSSSSDLVY